MNKRFAALLIILIIFYAGFNYYGTRELLLPKRYSGDLNYYWRIVHEINAKGVSYYLNAYSKVGTMIAVYGNVTQRLSPDITPPRHEIFLLGDLNDTSKKLKIIYNVDYLGRGWLNVKPGDLVVLVGELLPDAKSVHKVAEGLDLLLLYRPSDKMIIEVGYLPESDGVGLILIAVCDVLVLALTIIARKRNLI